MSWFDGESRFDRALSQRMYLLNAARTDRLSWEFTIEGSRGIPYRVRMNENSSRCTCPDFLRRRATCKHIIFISNRVLRLPTYLDRVTPEMDIRLNGLLVKQQGQPKQPEENQVTKTLLGDENEEKNKKAKLEGASCPICFEEFEPSKVRECDFCSTCKNPIHGTCMTVWLRQKQSCPLCRATWVSSMSQQAFNVADTAAGPNEALDKFLTQTPVPSATILASSESLGSNASERHATSSSSAGAAAAADAANVTTSAAYSHRLAQSERIPVTRAKEQFGLTDSDLAGFPYQLAPNPYYSYGPNMRLYLIRDCERASLAKQQRKEAAAAKRAEQEAQKRERDKKKAEREAKRAAEAAEQAARKAAKEPSKMAAVDAARAMMREKMARELRLREEKLAQEALKTKATESKPVVAIKSGAGKDARPRKDTKARKNTEARQATKTVKVPRVPQPAPQKKPAISASDTAKSINTAKHDDDPNLRRSSRVKKAKVMVDV